jgi:hypothetical protein
MLECQLCKFEALSTAKIEAKKKKKPDVAGGVAQVVGKHEALSSKSKYCQNKQTNRMPGPL